MTLPQLTCRRRRATADAPPCSCCPPAKTLPAALPERAICWQAVLKRRDTKVAELAKIAASPSTSPTAAAPRCVMVDAAKPRFERLTALRKAVMLLLDEHPPSWPSCRSAPTTAAVRDAALRRLGQWRAAAGAEEEAGASRCRNMRITDRRLASADFSAGAARWPRPILLARELTVLPPNELRPPPTASACAPWPRNTAGSIEEFDFTQPEEDGRRRLLRRGAGQRGHEDARPSCICRTGPRARTRAVALVGKGICFDTGGHNLKPASYMHGMHEDMNGSAVALGLLLAAANCKLPVAIDCWLAIAQNHISPEAYKQNDIVTALNGTTIEIVHTDAEGRMVLADTLTLAAQRKARTDHRFRHAHRQHALRAGQPLHRHLRHQRRTGDAGGRRRAKPAASASAPSRSTPTTSRRSTPRSPTSSNARSTARPTTSSPRASSSASPARPAVAAHGPVGLQLQRRAGRGGHGRHRLRRGLGRGLIADFGRNALTTASRVSI